MTRRETAAAAAALVGSFLAVRSGRAARLDRRAAGALARPLGPGGDVLVGAYTDLGSVYGLTGVAASLALHGHRRPAGEVLLAGGAAWVAAQAAKPLVGRDRPYVDGGAHRLVAVPAGSSWPSGHVAVATAMAGALRRHLPRAGRCGLAVAVTGVAASRCYVGVHHLSDVIAGWGVGVLAAGAVGSTRRRTVPGTPSRRSRAGGP